MPTDLLEGLNEPQFAAVTHPDGPVLILAGPGSGKTRVITHRIAYLMQAENVAPWHVLAVTFTNKAAREMKERLLAIAGEAAEHVTMGTFHSVCVRILRTEHEAARLDRRFVIYADDDQMAIMKRVLTDLGVDARQFTPRAVLSAISNAKSQLIHADSYAANSYFEEVVRRAYERYQSELYEARALDFDDLLMRCVDLFRDEPEVLRKYQERYQYVLIDEFQDTNVCQYVWARLLAGERRNICVVGDPDQSIYSWRSADIRNILNFEQDYPDATIVKLEENYRSTKTILAAASKLIALNTQRKEVSLFTNNGEGAPIVVREGYDEDEEAFLVAQEVERLVARDQRRWGDSAVLYRTNAQSRALEEAMVRANIPYRLIGATKFYDRKEIKDLLAYLRLLRNPFDSVSLQRVVNVPPRGIGQKTLEELGRFGSVNNLPLYTVLQIAGSPDSEETAGLEKPRFTPKITRALAEVVELLDGLQKVADTQPVGELFDALLERTKFRTYVMDALEDGDDRWENVQELRGLADQFADSAAPEGLEAFLDNVALVADVDNIETGLDAVTLITLHQAKGLEYPFVFIVGMEEGVIPHIRSLDDPKQMEEERRLAYVGITRARERLYLFRAFRRITMGTRMPNPPSRFLRDIPANLIVQPGRPTSAAAGGARRFPIGGGTGSGGPVRTTPVWGSPSTTTRVLSQSVSAASASAAPPPAAKAAFGTGEHVKHPQFGEGIVVSCEPAKDDQLITVAFKGGAGVKRLLLSFAPLEKVAG